MNNTLFSILNQDRQASIATSGFFSNYPVETYFIKNQSALILGKSDHLWAHIAGKNQDDIVYLLDKYHHKTNYFFSVEDWAIPLILRHGEADWIMTTDRYILEPSVRVAPSIPPPTQLDASYAAFIYHHSDYKTYISIPYIEDRLEKDCSAGMMVEGSLVAWGFTHDDGALGFLHVLEAFRHCGYGKAIASGLIQMKRAKQQPVFCNIVPENLASTKLATKIGFALDRRVSWIKLK